MRSAAPAPAPTRPAVGLTRRNRYSRLSQEERFEEPCAEGRADCDAPAGHLRPFGEQMELENITEYDLRGDSPTVDAPLFWRNHIAPYEPAVLRGGASQVGEGEGEGRAAPYTHIASATLLCSLA